MSRGSILCCALESEPAGAQVSLENAIRTVVAEKVKEVVMDLRSDLLMAIRAESDEIYIPHKGSSSISKEICEVLHQQHTGFLRLRADLDAFMKCKDGAGASEDFSGVPDEDFKAEKGMDKGSKNGNVPYISSTSAATNISREDNLINPFSESKADLRDVAMNVADARDASLTKARESNADTAKAKADLNNKANSKARNVYHKVAQWKDVQKANVKALRAVHAVHHYGEAHSSRRSKWMKIINSSESVWSKENDKKRPVVVLTKSPAFNGLCGFMIVANALTIGWTADVKVRRCIEDHEQAGCQDNVLTNRLEMAFTLFFTLEIFLRIWAEKLNFFTSEARRWNIFDIAVVFLCGARYGIHHDRGRVCEHQLYTNTSSSQAGEDYQDSWFLSCGAIHPRVARDGVLHA